MNHLKLQNYSSTTRLKLRCWQFCWMRHEVAWTVVCYGYGRLHLSAPETKRFFIVPFTVQNPKEGREERDSIAELQKLIHALLATTNWRLMSDGIYNQFGVLTGRLRRYHCVIHICVKYSWIDTCHIWQVCPPSFSLSNCPYCPRDTIESFIIAYRGGQTLFWSERILVWPHAGLFGDWF